MGPDASPLRIKTIFVLFCLLHEVGSIDIQASERGDVSFECPHSYAWSNNKYFCKDPCKTDGDILVRVPSGQKAESGRISLADLGNGVLVVNISRLQLSDSGVYWCGVDRAISDTFISVHLTVNRAPDVSTTLPLTTFSHETTAMRTTPFTTGAGTDSTLTNSTVGGEHLVNTGTVLFAGLGAVVMIALLILVAYFRKCRNRSKAQPYFFISNRDLLNANKATANPQRSVVAKKARQQLPRKREESFPYDRHPKGKPRTTVSAAENGEPSHIYMNFDCSKGTARSRDQAANAYEVPDVCAVYINV